MSHSASFWRTVSKPRIYYTETLRLLNTILLPCLCICSVTTGIRIQCHEVDNSEEDQSAIASCIATCGKAIRNKFDANPRQATQYAQGVRRRVYALRIAESIFRKGFHGAAREQRAECREPSQHGLYSALCSLLSALCSPHSALRTLPCSPHSALCTLLSALCTLC